jgi:nucleoside-diphosphate-sugar epimerase/predicted dehydrogenase
LNATVAPTAVRRAAIIGAGMISSLHIRGLRRLGIEVAGIADSDVERARSRAREHSVPAVFASLRDLLDAVQPDAVHVLTPPVAHADLAIEALEAGSHVYVEKPMAPTEAECTRMIDSAARAGRQLCVGHSLVFDPLMQQALRLIADGAVGEVIHVSATYAFDPARIPGYSGKTWYRRLGGGFLEDLAAHPASLLVRLLGAPASVRAAPAPSASASDVGVAALVQSERGTGALLVSLAARPEEVSLEIRGTGGTLRLDFSSMVLTLQRERPLPRKLAHGIRNLHTASQLAGQTIASTARVLRGRADTTKGIHSLIAEFYRAVQAGSSSPVSGTEGSLVVRLVRAVWPEPHAQHAPPSRSWPARAAHRPSALVTGATGFIGRHLVRELVNAGWDVRALVRDAARGRHLESARVHVVLGDLADPDAFPGLAEGVDTVFHLASAMRGSREVFESVDLDGTRHLLEEAKRAGVRRFVFTSTLGAYALGRFADGAVVTEEMTDDPDSVGAYARAKLLIERMLADAQRAGTLEVVIARLGLVFGPGASPFLEHLPHLGMLRGDRYIVFGDGRVPLQLSYVDNAVAALRLCATVPAAAGETFTIIDDDVPTQREYVLRLAELTGRPLRIVAVPRPAAYLVGLGVEALARVTKLAPPTTRQLMLGKTRKLFFDCSRAKRILGWTPEVRWEEGLRRAVAAAGLGTEAAAAQTARSGAATTAAGPAPSS